MRTFTLIFWIALCLSAGFLGSRWTAPEIAGWYRTLTKPSFNPPSWVFAPVWTTLYLLMAVAAWRVGASVPSPVRTWALAVFLLQLALNLLWPWLFFHLHRTGAALAEVILLWLAIAATILVFARIDAPSAWLLAPYLAWVTFASVLNAAIHRLNQAPLPSARLLR